MGCVGQLVRCNILCKKHCPYWKYYLKWNGGIWSCTETFLWVSTVNEKEKDKENVDTSPEMQEYKYSLHFPPPYIYFFLFTTHRYLGYWDFNQGICLLLIYFVSYFLHSYFKVLIVQSTPYLTWWFYKQ